MKAIVYTKYGSADVLQLTDVEKPRPKDDEVLVKVMATAVNVSDALLLKGEPFVMRLTGGLRSPKNQILGADIAGQVEAVGANVTQFQVGDAVFGDLSAQGRGGFAEYVAAPASALALKPANRSFAEAAAVPMTAVTALQGLRDKGQLQAGQQVLINGASGGVGTFAVQIAKALGGVVTAVVSTRKKEMVRAIGADHIIDYTQEDFTQNGQQYDLIFDTVGNHSVAAYKRVLQENGRFVTTAFLPSLVILGPWLSLTEGKKMSNMMAKPNQKDLDVMKELVETNQVIPIIDRCYPLSDVAEVLRYLGEGHAKGKVIITMSNNSAEKRE